MVGMVSKGPTPHPPCSLQRGQAEGLHPCRSLLFLLFHPSLGGRWLVVSNNIALPVFVPSSALSWLFSRQPNLGGEWGEGLACPALTDGSPPPQLHQVLVQLQVGEKEQDFSLTPIQVSISVQLWRLPGCHEFLAALGREGVGVVMAVSAWMTGRGAWLSGGGERPTYPTDLCGLLMLGMVRGRPWLHVSHSFSLPFPPLLLAGFDLCEVGQEEVILKTGKQASRRAMHFALQTLLALFGKALSCLAAFGE